MAWKVLKMVVTVDSVASQLLLDMPQLRDKVGRYLSLAENTWQQGSKS